MDSWYTQRNNAIETYHNHLHAKALELFEQLLEETPGVENAVDLQLWMVSCHRALHNFDQALKLLEEIEDEDFMLSPSIVNRIQLVKADLAAEMCNFEQALQVYEQLLATTTSYDDLYYLEMRIDETIRNFEAFKEHGTIEQWKQKLLERVQAALAFFTKSE